MVKKFQAVKTLHCQEPQESPDTPFSQITNVYYLFPIAHTYYLLLMAYCPLQITNCQLLNDQNKSQSHLNSHTSLTP